jgi:hypothetical protein
MSMTSLMRTFTTQRWRVRGDAKASANHMLKQILDSAFDCIPMRQALGDKGTDMRRKCRNILRLKTRVKSRTVAAREGRSVKGGRLLMRSKRT